MEDPKQPFLVNGGGGDEEHYYLERSHSSAEEEEDMKAIDGVSDFIREFFAEFKRFLFIATPTSFCIVSQYSIGAVIMLFAGQLGDFQLAAVSLENSVLGASAFGIMLGMGSAQETLCGQAFGAGQLDMLTLTMQRSWLILTATALPLTSLYIFAGPLLNLIGQDPKIADLTGTYAVWMIPTIFSFAMNLPIQKFLQAQSKILVMAVISGVVVVLHTCFAWLFMIKLRWGLAGAALVENVSLWLIILSQLFYAFRGSCGKAWSGFSWKAFENLLGFIRLSLSSAIMICLQYWYFVLIVLSAGYLKNAEKAIGALSIWMNILDWTIMVAYGFNAAISTRVSNELGAGHPRAARFSVLVVLVAAFLFGTFFAIILMVFRKDYPLLFSNSSEIQHIVSDFTPILGFTIFVQIVNQVSYGVAIGAGWQVYMAWVNIICYYLFGIPVGLILCYVLDMGIKGIWYGMLSGTIAQSIILFRVIYRTNWTTEVSMAEGRVKQWGGNTILD